jgi:hypothetical protein
MKTKIKVLRITLAVILALGLSLTNVCAALSSFKPAASCKTDKSINHQVDHVKKTSCKMLPCKTGQGRPLLSPESAELRNTKGSFLPPATIHPGQFEVSSHLTDHRQATRTALLHPPATNTPPIYIKYCALLR